MTGQHHRRFVIGWIIALPALIALACSIGAAPVTPTPIIPPTSAINPVVAILSPQNGTAVSLNTPMTVQVNAQHPDGITRVELSANGQVVDSRVSQNPLGDVQLQANLNYTPTAAGALTLTVIAYRGSQPSNPASVTVNVGSTTPTPTPDTSSGDTGGSSGDTTGGVVSNQPCQAQVAVNSLNFRQGPGQNYASLQVLSVGTIIPITGAIPDLTWWQGQYNNTTGWLNHFYITLLGNCNSVPAIQPPASPIPVLPTLTPIPQATSPQATVATIADLAVISITGSTSVILDAQNTASASYQVTIQNLGTASANNFVTEIQLPDGTLQQLGVLGTLAPGQQAIMSASITFTNPGIVRLTVIIDRANVVPESDKTNNLKSLDILVIKPTPTS